MSEFLKLAGGALVGILVGLGIQWWKSQRDELRILVDEFCKAVTEAGNVGSDYWLAGGDAPNARLQEARLLGLQKLLDGYRVLMGHLVKDSSAVKGAAMVEFFAVLTGGDFKSRGRAANEAQSILVQARGAELILSIRSAFHHQVGFRATVARMIDRTFGFTR